MPTDDQISDAESWLKKRQAEPGWGAAYDRQSEELSQSVAEQEYATKTGRRLTQEDIDELVVEAEAGYDVSSVTNRFTRVGEEIHIIDPVRPSLGVTGVPDTPHRRITREERLTIERDAAHAYIRTALEELTVAAGLPLINEHDEKLRNFQLVLRLIEWIKEAQ